MKFNFRQAHPSDLDAVLALFRAAVLAVPGSDYDEEQRRVWASGSSDYAKWKARIEEQYFLLAEAEEQLCGFASLSAGGYLDLLYVHPDFQKVGLGGMLLRRLIRYAELGGYPELVSDVSATARPVLEHLGFTAGARKERRIAGVEIHNYRMTLLLPVVITTTDHLRLRRFLTGDGQAMYELNSDPEVLRYTGDPPFADGDAAEAFVSAYDHYVHYGLGRWVVTDKVSGDFLGWCGLKYSPELEETDLGFRFFRRHWNKGYATESARACVEYAFGRLGLQRLVGRAMRANSASVRVLEKVGFQYWKDFDFEGQPGVYYLLEKG